MVDTNKAVLPWVILFESFYHIALKKKSNLNVLKNRMLIGNLVNNLH